MDSADRPRLLPTGLSIGESINEFVTGLDSIVSKRRMSFFGKCIDMIVIARRSRHYAGTRYLKRGTSVHGKVANDCEIEQVFYILT